MKIEKMYDFKEIEKKKVILDTVKVNLKKKFVGLDKIIDKIISNLEVWYLMPDLLTRPIIINLWGLTGVGKTDLVRSLVRELKFQEKFVEVQLDTGTESSNGYYSQNTIKNEIDSVGIKESETGIVLLDEMQRFRHLDELGKMINNSKYQDIWMLLSDGKLNTKDFRKRNLQNLLIELYFLKDLEEDEPNEKKKSKKKKNKIETAVDETEVAKPKPTKQRKFKMSLWSAREIKQAIESDEPLEEIMKWDFHKKVEEINKKIKSMGTVEEEDKRYSKLLIFISGNIDKAYEMSDDVSETNVDADILHEFSKNINIIDIKNALKYTFKPEQIARFGNVHIIYPSLSKNNYYSLIDLKINEIINKIAKFNINISFDQSIKDAIYRNGVYPSQGVRPLFSTIGSLIENSIPTFLMAAVMKGSNEILFNVDVKKKKIIGKIMLPDKGFVIMEKDIILELDNIKHNLNESVFYKTCVHETGHAIAYALHYKVAPPQIVGDSISSYNAGFIIPHDIEGSKEQLEHKIQILLAGTVAEEIVFGVENKGSGASHDLMMATSVAGQMIRSKNMHEGISYIVDNNYQSAHMYNTDMENSNPLIEELLKEQKIKIKQLLEDNIDFYKDVLNKLTKKKRLLPEEFYEISKKYDKKIKVVKNSHKIIVDYKNLMKKFFNDDNTTDEYHTVVLSNGMERI